MFTLTRKAIYLIILPSLLLSPQSFADIKRLDAKDEIIMLIEDNLSTAYSFTAEEAEKIPDFSILDRIFPNWHHGKPAESRKTWLKKGYLIHQILYRVDFITMQSEFRAKAKGKKLVIWTNNDKPLPQKEFWQVQLWAQAEYCKKSLVECDYMIYSQRYSMDLEKSNFDHWFVVREHNEDKPRVPHTVKKTCSLSRQLGDFCPKCDCPAPVEPLFKDEPAGECPPAQGQDQGAQCEQKDE
jgi:hypothetical protein